MNKQAILDWFVIALVIGIGVYIVFFLGQKGSQCIANPISYTMNELDKSNDANITCICSGDRKEIGTIIMTKEGIKPFIVSHDNPYTYQNVSKILENTIKVQDGVSLDLKNQKVVLSNGSDNISI